MTPSPAVVVRTRSTCTLPSAELSSHRCALVASANEKPTSSIRSMSRSAYPRQEIPAKQEKPMVLQVVIVESGPVSFVLDRESKRAVELPRSRFAPASGRRRFE